MKKIVTILSLMLLTFSLVACEPQNSMLKPNDTSNEVEQSTDTQAVQETFEVIEYAFESQHIRTGGFWADADYDKIITINSRSELENYIKEDGQIYDFSRGKQYGENPAISFIEATEKYDDNWFESHQMVIVIAEVGSGMFEVEVSKVKRLSTNELMIEVDLFCPDGYTFDIQSWHLIVELEKNTVQESDDIQMEIYEKDINEFIF